jgi:uncharacterized protein (DUF488 family)
MEAEPKVLKINLRGDTPQEIIDLLDALQRQVIFYFGLWQNAKAKYESKNFILRFIHKKKHETALQKFFKLFAEAQNKYVDCVQEVYFHQYGKYLPIEKIKI